MGSNKQDHITARFAIAVVAASLTFLVYTCDRNPKTTSISADRLESIIEKHPRVKNAYAEEHMGGWIATAWTGEGDEDFIETQELSKSKKEALVNLLEIVIQAKI